MHTHTLFHGDGQGQREFHMVPVEFRHGNRSCVLSRYCAEKAEFSVLLPAEGGEVVPPAGPVEDDPGGGGLAELLGVKWANGEIQRNVLVAAQLPHQRKEMESQIPVEQKGLFQPPDDLLRVRIPPQSAEQVAAGDPAAAVFVRGDAAEGDVVGFALIDDKAVRRGLPAAVS